ncbi:hypothetical protein L2K70_02330 [Nocardioides KLBMP 9356]|uniref:Uncharacterized protein n=1 Tax=Nocardioides potassii TaxID=2911371 RepID=A0ABS9H8A8_9ACTN|nr:hypothetical protein [Nocardioides potassii]MCF6376430.1 hypothetical protein [Nocardioides potassii]
MTDSWSAGELVTLAPAELLGLPDGPDVHVVLDENGVLVVGPPEGRSRAFKLVLEPLGGIGSQVSKRSLADTAAVAGSAAAVMAAGADYFSLTAEGAAKLAQFHEKAAPNGGMYGFVMNDSGQFAGQLTFDRASLVGGQALAMQTAATSMALRTAIAEVQAAVERVEERVDDIQRRLRAQQIGQVIGTHRHLDRVTRSSRDRGALLDADWESVAGVRTGLYRALEEMREFVRSQAADIDPRARLSKRESKLDDFLEPGGGRDVLDLILIAEQSLLLFEHLRLIRVQATQPEHLASALSEARDALATERTRDEELVATVMSAVDEVRAVAPLEIHRLLSAREMRQTASDIHASLTRFATAVRLPAPEMVLVEHPTIGQAREEVRARALMAGRSAKSLGSASADAGAGILRGARDKARERFTKDG